MLVLVLRILAALLFLLAAFGVGHPRAHLGWLGAAALAATLLFATPPASA